jgi:hypothetical protein
MPPVVPSWTPGRPPAPTLTGLPALAGTRSLDGSRIRRAPESARPGTTDGPPRVRRAGTPNVVRRLITDDQWQNQVVPKLGPDRPVTLWKDEEPIALTKAGDKIVAATPTGKVTITDEKLALVKARWSLVPPHLTVEPAFDAVAKEDKDKGLKVTELAGERMSMVHHTESTGAEKNAHLTVENAHVLAFQDLFGAPRGDVREKAKLDKAKINTALSTHGVGTVDNLNFYSPAKPAKRGAKAESSPHEQLPLSRYLAFVAHALEVGGAPPEYGQRMLQLASRLAETKKLDPSQLFLRADMDETAFVRAVLIIDSVLPDGQKLPIPDQTRQVFAKWWTVKDNPDKVPFLPPPDAPDGEATVKSGTQYKDTSFSKIEGEYCRAHFGALVTAVNAFTPAAAVQADAGNQAKGKGTAKGNAKAKK